GRAPRPEDRRHGRRHRPRRSGRGPPPAGGRGPRVRRRPRRPEVPPAPPDHRGRGVTPPALRHARRRRRTPPHGRLARAASRLRRPVVCATLLAVPAALALAPGARAAPYVVVGCADPAAL